MSRWVGRTNGAPARVETTIIILLFVAVPAIAGAPATRPADVPRTLISEAPYHLLRSAIDDHRFRGDSALADSRAGLDKLRKVYWPDFTKLQLVKVTAPDPKEGFCIAWRVPAPGPGLTILYPDLTTGLVPPSTIGKIESSNFADYSAALLKPAAGLDTGSRMIQFTQFSGGPMPFYPGSFLVTCAFAAAQIGRDADARALLHAALDEREEAVQWTYEEFAWQRFFLGIRMLDSGEPRGHVLAIWIDALKQFPGTRYDEQFHDYVTELQRQIPQEKAVAANPPVDPKTLPADRQIDFYIARLPDVHGEQFGQPGMCQTVGFGEGTRISNALVAIGRPALPALIEHLSDTRLTRSIGFHRDFEPDRTVLRCMDAAIECIDQITGIQFYHQTRTGSYLSTEKPAYRSAVINDIQTWWAQNKDKTPVQGLVARLDKGRVYDRTDILARIEKADPKAVDSIGLLKQWAAGTTGDEQAFLATELARRKDFTLLPRIRQAVHNASGDGVLDTDVWYLLDYGTVEDYRFIRGKTLQDIHAGARLGSAGFMESACGAVYSATNPLYVPIAVDLLAEREMTGSRYMTGMKQAMPFSTADSAMATLVRMTGHDEAYHPGDEPAARYAAIDRWLEWWNKTGKAAYLTSHPEVKLMYEP
jgi:hypothetical protein